LTDFDNRTPDRIAVHPRPNSDCTAGIVRWTANFVMRQTVRKPKLAGDGVIEAPGSIEATGGEHHAIHPLSPEPGWRERAARLRHPHDRFRRLP